MRGHGKLAVLKDDEVDRLERAGAATMGASRAEVLESMYNRLEPKPRGITTPFCFLCQCSQFHISERQGKGLPLKLAAPHVQVIEILDCTSYLCM